MFIKRSAQEKQNKTSASVNNEPAQNKLAEDTPKDVSPQPAAAAIENQAVNQILKGSKMIGDINVTCDLEMSGEVDGNITSMQQSNILIKGLCKGNIDTKEGSVTIEGEMQGGNITAGKNVTISGKVDGGTVKAGGRIFVEGKFNGRLEGNDIEMAANSSGKGEILYRESISISRGAKVEVKIAQTKEALKEVKSPAMEIKKSPKVTEIPPNTDSPASNPVQKSPPRELKKSSKEADIQPNKDLTAVNPVQQSLSGT